MRKSLFYRMIRPLHLKKHPIASGAIGIFIHLMCIMQGVSYAATPTPTPLNIGLVSTSTSPLVVFRGGTATATYTVTNQSSVNLTGLHLFFKNGTSNVGQVTSTTDPSVCSSSFELAPGASCRLILSITGNVNNNPVNPQYFYICQPGDKVCSGTYAQLDVTVISYAYIFGQIPGSTQNNYCQILPTGHFTPGTCPTQMPSSILVNGIPVNLGSPLFVNKAKSLLYFFDPQTGIIYSCTANIDGSLNQCQTASTLFTDPGNIVFNPQGTFAYVINFLTSTLSVCPVNTDGTFGACVPALGSISLNNIVSVAVTDANAYIIYNQATIPGNGNSIEACPVNADGTFNSSSCTSFGYPTNNFSSIIALNGYLYISSNPDNFVYWIAESNLGNNLQGISGFVNPLGLSTFETVRTVSNVNDTAYILYVAVGNNAIMTANIAATGALSTTPPSSTPPTILSNIPALTLFTL